MKRFACQACGAEIHFTNTSCVACGHRLGFLPQKSEMTALEPGGTGWRALAEPSQTYRFCANEQYDACNWLIETRSGEQYCPSCRHNHIIPDLSDPKNLENWRHLEAAKRQLFYSLLRWHLPMPTASEDQEKGLEFDCLADSYDEDGNLVPVMTGHNRGTITINVAEGDDVERERRRSAMGEPYRTLIGHFRHEIGHYYWDRLVADRQREAESRAIFGDHSEDYGEALKAHYANGAPPDWQTGYVSAYATSHPWEDFAETWAHYLHIVDALETAHAYDLHVARSNQRKAGSDIDFDPYSADSAAQLVKAWVPVTVAINAINRSMGQPDLYPFVLSKPVLEKLEFIHGLIHADRSEKAGKAA